MFLVGKGIVGVLDPVWFTVVRYALATMLLLALVQCFGHSPWAKAGVATVTRLLGSSAADTTASQLGDLITLAGTLGWVFYTCSAASLPDHSPLEYTALTGSRSAAMAGGRRGAGHGVRAGCAAPPAVLAGLAPELLYVAVVPTVVAALAFNVGERRLGAPVGTLFVNVVPVSVIAVRAVFGAPPQASELIGAGLLAMALALHAWPARSISAPNPAGTRCRGVHAR